MALPVAVPVGRGDLKRVGLAEAEAHAPAVELDGDGIAEGGDLDDAETGAGEKAHGEESLGEGPAPRHVGDFAGAVQAEVLQARHDRPFDRFLGPPQAEQYPKILWLW